MPNTKEMLGVGDCSGRMDTSGVDPEVAQNYAELMFWAVVNVDFRACRELHATLNKDWALYQLALDLYRQMCHRRGQKSGRWKEYCDDLAGTT